MLGRRAAIAALIAVTTAAAALGCGGIGLDGPRGSPAIVAAEAEGALAISDALERLIDEGEATAEDRAYAWEAVKRMPVQPTAGDAFGRAAVAGRLVQQRGLAVAGLVARVEQLARRSRELDPGFRDGAATRMLGTLYVLAPGPLLESGDSEEGLALLEELAAARPEVIENQLRLAEARIALGEREAALGPLCRAVEARAALRPDDQRLLDRLLADTGEPDCGRGAFRSEPGTR